MNQSNIEKYEKLEFISVIKNGIELQYNEFGKLKNCVLYINNSKLCIGKNMNSNDSFQFDLNKIKAYPFQEKIIVFTALYNEVEPPPIYNIYTTTQEVRDYIIKMFNSIDWSTETTETTENM
jgi:hypothetical protein